MAIIACKECKNQISTTAKACPQCGAKPKKTSIFFKLLLALFCLPIFIAMFSGKNSTTSPGFSDGSSSKPEKTSTELSDLSLDFKPSKSGFGNIATISGRITNSGPTSVKDLRIECVSSAASGTVIDKNNRTLYEVVDPGKPHTFKDFNMGFINSQVQSISCEVVSFSKI